MTEKELFDIDKHYQEARSLICSLDMDQKEKDRLKSLLSAIPALTNEVRKLNIRPPVKE